MPASPQEIAFQLGLFFIAAVIFGRIARIFKIPRIAGYLVGGLLVGPQLFGFISEEVVVTLKPLSQFALALIMFDIGTNFRLKRLKKQGLWLKKLIIADIAGTMIIVFFAVLFAGGGFTFALLLGILAIATAPAATLLVLKEFDAEGEVTESIITLVGINNTVCIVLFEIILAILISVKGEGNFFIVSGGLLLSLIFAIILGAGGGIVISYVEQKVSGDERFILFLGFVVMIFGVSLLFGLPFMLVFLLMGVTLVNVSEFAKEILQELDRVGWPLYVLFFLLAGAKLHLDSLQTLGIVSIVYLLARSAGKIVGVKIAARLEESAPSTAREIGWGMLSQAGVAVGLSMIAVQKLPSIGYELETIIVSTVIVFEIVGSILVKVSVVRAGEVKIVKLLDRPESRSYPLSIRAMMRNLLSTLGIRSYQRSEQMTEFAVHQVMRKNVKTVAVNATFPEIMNFMSHSKYNNFPVTGYDNHYEGMISYSEVREAIYDPGLSHIMIAKDFARWKDARISPEAELMDALEMFNRLNIDCLPVVDDKSGKLMGLLEQKEVLSLCGNRGI